MYKELLLDNTKMVQAIYNFFNMRYKEVKVLPEDRPNNSKFIETRYNVEFDGEKLFLGVFINSKGKTTLKVKEGKHQDIKAKLADFIKIHCKVPNSMHNKSMLFKLINFDEFVKVIELIKKDGLCQEVNIIKDDTNERIYKLKGSYNDIVTVTYKKTTENVRIQGIPLLVYNLCVSYVNELVSIDKVIENLDENLNENISTLSIEEQYKLYLPNSYDKHTEKLKKSLLRAVYNLNVNSQEYTCTELVFEVLRALEGHIKITLSKDYGITSSSVFGKLSMFTYDYNNDSARVKDYAKTKILQVKDRVSYYEKAYKHIVIYRHKYFNWDFPDVFGNDGTVQLDDVNVAKKLIKDTLAIIDEYYKL